MAFHSILRNHFLLLTKVNSLASLFQKDGIYIDPDRIKEISDIPFPHNKKTMQSFLGQIIFFKRFVPNFSQIILPLQIMVKKNSVFKWGYIEKKLLIQSSKQS